MQRWIPALSMLAVSLISYIDRNTLAILAPTILKDTGLSNREYGFIISAFSIVYMLANPVWGRILDRAGLRRGMTAAVTSWTIASVSHAFARAALGFGEGATFPGGAGRGDRAADRDAGVSMVGLARGVLVYGPDRRGLAGTLGNRVSPSRSSRDAEAGRVGDAGW
jgi:MFS family permease